MSNIEVGEYVRTDKGYIAKIKEFIPYYTEGRRLGKTEKVKENYLLLGAKQCEIIESIDYSIPPCYPTDEELEKIKKHIAKHSPNIIDLIEVGDYVNGKLIHHTDIRKNSAYIYYGNGKTFVDYQIKTIVTREQFASMEYKIEAEE